MSSISGVVRVAGKWGGYEAARWLCRNHPRILMYHRFSEQPKTGFCSRDAFEWQVDYIRRKFNPMTLAGLVRSIEIHGRPPKNAVVITVDDGYKDFFGIAKPILQRHDVPATVFVTTGFIDGRLWLWPDQLAWLLANAGDCLERVILGTTHISPSSPTAWGQIIGYLLSVPDFEREVLIQELAKQLGTVLPPRVPEEFSAMSWKQLIELESDGFEVGGHTVHHPTLGQVSEEGAWWEIKGAYDELIEHLGTRPRTFCYPNGQPSDFQHFLPRLVRNSGFEGAVMAFPDALGVNDRYAMRRHSAGENVFQFMKAVSGIEYLGHRLKKNVRLPMNTHLN